jgi:hypothetical protein
MLKKSAVRLSLLVTSLAVIGLLLVVPSFLAAQATSGVTGVVTDQSGAVVAGTEVKLTNPATGFSATTTTNDLGAYEFRHVIPGTYTLTFSKDKFRTVTVSNFSLGVSVVETKNARLEVGKTSETIEVKASGEGTVNTVDASIGNVITTKQIEELPSIFLDNATAVLQLQPGVQSAATGDSQQGSVTGSRADAGSVTLDGLDVTDQRIGEAFFAVGRAPIDSISEVRTIVGGADASYGRSGGAQVDLATKSGTNQFHGDLYEFNRVSAEAANSYFNNFNGVTKRQLTRNQFGGSVGGPIIKDKLFFFADYAGLRQAAGIGTIVTVPMDPFRQGQLSYVNNNGQLVTIPATGTKGAFDPTTGAWVPGCTTPTTSSTSCSVAGIDPQGVGQNQAFASFLASIPYPEPNTVGGDGINTAGYLFNAPDHQRANTFVGRLDYTLSSRHSLFARATWDRDFSDEFDEAFPNEQPVVFVQNHQRSWVVSDFWTINSRMVNNAFFGLTRQMLNFPYNPNSAPNLPVPNLYGFGALSVPYGDFRQQASNVPVPEIRDTFSWSLGKHSLQFGADIKPIRVHNSNTNDVNFPSIGVTSNILSLSPNLRPPDIDTAFAGQWDLAFTTLLGRWANTTAQYNYDRGGNPQPQFSPYISDFHYNEYEFFVQDSWKVRSDLTVTYGLRWNYHSVPFEATGLQSVANVFEKQMFTARQQAAASGVNGFTAAPFVTYNLGGAANHAPGYYHPDWRDFAPRVGIAYSPSFTNGVLGHVLGDRKTSIRMGAGMFYDRVASTLTFEQSEVSELFSTSTSQFFGIPGNAPLSLLFDPRFTSISTPPTPPPPGVPGGATTSIPQPYTPFVIPSNGSNCPVGSVYGVFGGSFVPAGQPCGFGLFTLQTLYQFDNQFKTPYNISLSFGFQRELPRNFLLEVNYFGKLGRRLEGTGDPAQQLNFVDPTSGQSLNNAFANVQAQICGVSGPGQCGEANLQNLNLQTFNPGLLAAQPWFENQMTAAIAQAGFPGVTCPQFATALSAVFGVPLPNVNSCTALVASPNLFGLPPNFMFGDLSTVVSALADFGLLLPNTGLPYQTGSIANVGNFAASDYHSLIVTLRKKFSDNLLFDFDYAYAHGIDNVSDIANDSVLSSFNGQGLICDLRNLRTCRGDADFDARHTISANYFYQLPIGRGQRLFSGMPKWADEIVGGWGTSGIVSYHTGYPFTSVTNGFPINFTQLGPAVLSGPRSLVKEHIHVETNPNTGQPSLQLFANPQNAVSAFTFPFGGGTGERNTIHGPGYVNIDMVLSKTFKVTEGTSLEFQAEAFNAFNHANFNSPNVNAGAYGSIFFNNVNIQNPNLYGDLISTVNNPRELSLGLRFRF